MRILLLSNFFSPEKTGIGVTATDSARYLSELDHDVEVITTVPYYPEWSVASEYRNRLLVRDTVDGIPTTRVWMYVPSQPTTLKRVLHEISGAASMFLASLFKRCDLILCMSPPLSLGFAAMILAKLRRRPYWCYVLDIQPDAAIELNMLNNPLVRRVSVWMERWMYRGADLILLLSEGMQSNLERKGVPAEKLRIIPNSVDLKELRNIDFSGTPFRERCGLADEFVILYSGNLGIKHNVEIIAECAEALREEPEFRFVVVGDGAAKESLLRIIDRHNLTNISLHPLCEREELPEMIHSADVLLAPQRKEVTDIVVPSKLLTYLASGTPVVASVASNSETAKLLLKHDAGTVVPPEDVHALCQALREIKANPNEARERAERGLAMVRELFDRGVVKDRYYQPLFQGND